MVQNFELISLLHYYKNTVYNINEYYKKKILRLPKRLHTVSSEKSYIKAVMLFNNLPNEYKTIKSLAQRKKKLKKWILENEA